MKRTSESNIKVSPFITAESRMDLVQKLARDVASFTIDGVLIGEAGHTTTTLSGMGTGKEAKDAKEGDKNKEAKDASEITSVGGGFLRTDSMNFPV